MKENQERKYENEYCSYQHVKEKGDLKCIKQLLRRIEDKKVISNDCLKPISKKRNKISTFHMDFTDKTFQTVTQQRIVPMKEDLVLNSIRNLKYNSSVTPYKHLKGLKSLSIALIYLVSEDETPLFPNDKRVTNISLLLKNIKTLSNLKLDLEGYNEPLNIKWVNKLSWALKSLKSLSNLEISFYRCPQVTSNFLKKLGTLKTLTSLSLNLAGTDIGGMGLDSISLALKNLSALTILKLNLDDNEIGHDNVQFFCETLSGLELLTVFRLSCQLTNEDFTNLSSVLRTLRSLSILGLDLSYSMNLGDIGITNFSYILKDLHSLSSLDLDFGYIDKKTKEGIKSLFDALKYIKTLKRLKLNFFRPEKIEYEDFEHISHSVGDLNPTLTHFELTIRNYGFKRKPFPMSSLFLSLKNLKYLTFLHLDTIEYQINEKDVDILSSTLRGLKMLTGLELFFVSGNNELKVDSMKNFSLALKELSSLKRLALEFYQCYIIPEEGIVEMCKAIKTLQNLTYLKLSVYKCDEIRIGLLEKVVNILKDIKSLSRLVLSVSEYEEEEIAMLYSFCEKVGLFPILEFSSN